MKTAKGIFRFIKNKYVITLVAMAGWLLFFDRNDVFSQMERHREVMKLQSEADYYHNQIKRNQEQQAELTSDPKLLEKFARENYLMKKDSEDVYIIVRDSLK
ncbi:MAG TPA: septum formation initiator family protein [Bacteroidia bacterium]|jgi:cell division protein FtsB|nr:septum formation initiator family protein [Bacteroidia bacterium]